MGLVDHVRVIPCEKSKIPARVSAETGFYTAWKGFQEVAFQSSLERSFVQLCDFANEVQAIRWEPLTILFSDLVDKKERRYTPDYLVEVIQESGSRRTFIVEVKPKAETDRIWRDDPEGLDARRHIAMMAWCRQQPATRFVLVSEKLLREKGVRNMATVLDRASYGVADNVRTELLRLVEGGTAVRLDELVQGGESLGLDRGSVISSVLRLCADDEIAFDVTGELDDATTFRCGPRNRVFNR